VVLDAWAFGSGRRPVGPGLVVPAAAWAYLYLPSAQTFIGR
jgi:hypothetical protein